MAEVEKPLIRIAAPLFARISPRVRARLGIVLVTTAALLFPLLNQNDADIDSAANALAFASLGSGSTSSSASRDCSISAMPLSLQ